VSRTLRSGEDHIDEQGSMHELDAMLPRCDFLAATCPLNEMTRGLIDARRLALCKPQLVIINVARAAVLEEEALYRALRDRLIAGAVLDVWYAYPTPENPTARPSRLPFHELANVIMTPTARRGRTGSSSAAGASLRAISTVSRAANRCKTSSSGQGPCRRRTAPTPNCLDN
jgi:phosphoglycerate dehydrogenase-like enzyme